MGMILALRAPARLPVIRREMVYPSQPFAAHRALEFIGWHVVIDAQPLSDVFRHQRIADDANKILADEFAGELIVMAHVAGHLFRP